MNADWLKTSLGKLQAQGNASIQTGPFGTVLKAAEYSVEGVPVVSVGEIRRGYIEIHERTPRVPRTVQLRLPQFLLEEGDIVFGRKGGIDRNALIGPRESGWFLGSDGIRLRLSDAVASNFVSYQFRSPAIGKWLLGNSSGSIMPSLNEGVLGRLPLWLPELDEQKRIAAVLSALDAKIDLNQRINAELEALAKTIYNYWFVQFDFPDAQGRPYKSSGGAMVWNDALKREIPAGWSVTGLGTWIAKQKTGEWGNGEFGDNSEVRVTCIRGADINALNGMGELSAPTRYISSSKSRKFLASHDVVIEISGGSPTQSTGRAALISPEVIQRFDNPLVCSNFCKALTLEEPGRAHEFLQLWNALYSAGVFFGWEGKTSGIKNLRFDSFIENYSVPAAPKELSQKFQALSRSLEKRKQNGLRENAELTQLRDWLLPLLMNGQVRVA